MIRINSADDADQAFRSIGKRTLEHKEIRELKVRIKLNLERQISKGAVADSIRHSNADKEFPRKMIKAPGYPISR